MATVKELQAELNALRHKNAELEASATDLKRAEEALRDSEEKYRLLFEEALDMTLVADAETGIILDCNKAATQLTGWSREELIGRHQRTLHPPTEDATDDAGEFSETFKRHITDKEGQNLEAQILTRSGEIRDVLIKANLLQIKGKNLIQGIFHDITEEIRIMDELTSHRERLEELVREKTAKQTLAMEKLEEEILRRKESELELRTALEQLQGILDNSPSLIFVKDTEGRFLFINRQFETTHAISNEQARGKSHFELFPKKFADQLQRDDQEVVRTARPLTSYEQLRDDKGVFVTTKFPLFNENGAVKGLCGIATDISEQKRAEQELLIAKEAAEAASRSKSEFLANMSHELRTPLNGILGMTELILSELPPEQLPRMGDIKDSASRLLKLINNILDISMIEADRMEVSEYPLSLSSLGQSVLHAFVESAEQKGLSLSLEVDENLPDVVVGDEGHLRQVLENFMDNAVKFTEQGEVSLAIKCGCNICPTPETLGDGPYQRDFLFCVRDTGIGIALEDQEKIFDLFTQLDGALNRRYAGTGLGLALCKKLACLMNGTIRMESTPGKGSEFSFTVPLEIQKEYFLASRNEG